MTPNKYRPDGTLYTSTELSIRRHRLTPNYIVRHNSYAMPKPHNTGRNAKKRLARLIHGVRK